VLPAALVRAVDRPGGSPVPLLLCCFAAATDYVDGPLARRRGPTRHGALLDGLADVSFVLAGTATGVHLGLLPLVAPLAIAAAFTAYALAALRRGGGKPAVVRTRVGHAAGVCNYVLAALVAAAVAWPRAAWQPWLAAGAFIVTALNLAAIALRALRRRR
jgi:phosphatidylglycerophosphate synthase